MTPDSPRLHLNRISTPWTLVHLAHSDAEPAAAAAQRLLLQRYSGAAYRYLRGALHDEDAALELFQEFVLRFLRGDFRRADPAAGRFRDYLRAALSHLVTDYHRERQAHPQPLPPDLVQPALAPTDEGDSAAAFLHSWREELVNRAWEALAEARPIYHAALLFHVQNPDATSPQMAEQLSTQLSKPFTAAHIRVTLHRAREKFAQLLLDEVTHSLGACTDAELIEELRTLRLLKLCAPALERRQRRLSGS